jgi:hypothetical protein
VPEKEGFLAEPLLMVFARGGGGDRRWQAGLTAFREMGGMMGKPENVWVFKRIAPPSNDKAGGGFELD